MFVCLNWRLPSQEEVRNGPRQQESDFVRSPNWSHPQSIWIPTKQSHSWFPHVQLWYTYCSWLNTCEGLVVGVVDDIYDWLTSWWVGPPDLFWLDLKAARVWNSISLNTMSLARAVQAKVTKQCISQPDYNFDNHIFFKQFKVKYLVSVNILGLSVIGYKMNKFLDTFPPLASTPK